VRVERPGVRGGPFDGLRRLPLGAALRSGAAEKTQAFQLDPRGTKT